MLTLKLGKLKDLILQKAFRYSEKPPFKLTSGAESPFYFDLKTVTLDPEGAFLVGEIIFDIIKDWPATAIGGLTLGADPIAAAVMHSAWRAGHRINHFIVRKESKKHGTAAWIEGNVKPGDKVVVVDDVVTTGGSTIKAIERARLFGLDVIGVVVLLDREEFDGIQNVIEELGAENVTAIVKRSDIMERYRRNNQ